MENHIKIPIIVGIVVLIIILLFGAGFLAYQSQIPGKNALKKVTLACTQEAKICPDGSSVTRVEPSCEFAMCPPITTGWKTYTDKNYGFEIKYPANWSSGTNLFAGAPNMVFCSAKYASLKTGCAWQNSTGPSPKPATNAELGLFISKDNLGLQNCDQTEQRIVNGIKMQIKYCGTRGIDAVWASKDGLNNYEFRLMNNASAQNFFQIILTFKFTK